MKLTQEEIDALISYSGYSHAEINAIMKFNPELVRENEDLGFNLDFSKENIKKNIEKIKLIYSAMYKYSKEKSKERTVYRGTNTAEISEIKKSNMYSQFLSTSDDERVSDMFATLDNATKNPSKLELKIKDVPYVYMPDIYSMAEGEIDRTDEEEILLAPYTSINKLHEKENRGKISMYSAEIDGFDRESVSSIEDFNEDEIIEKYSNLAKISKEYFEIKFELKKLEKAKESDKTLTDDEYNQIKDELNGKLRTIQDEISSANLGMENYLKSSFVDIEKNIEKEIEEERQAEILNRPKKLVAEVDSSKNYLDYQINSIKSQIDKINRKLHIDGFGEVESLGIDLSSVKKEIDNDFINKFQKVLEQLEEVQKEIESITASEDMDVEELSKVTSKLHQKEDYVREISTSVTFIDSNILPQAINKYTSKVRVKLNEKVAQKLHDAESKRLKDKISENKKSMSSPFAKFGKKSKSLKLMDEYLTNRLSNNELVNFDSINPAESVDNYLKKYQDESIIKLSEKLQKIPDSLKSILSNQKYEVDLIPEIPNEKNKLEKFEMEMKLLIDEQKSRSNNGRNDRSLNLKKELESNVENSELSYRFESIFRNLRNLSKDENTTKNSIDISDILRDENEQVI